MIVPVFGPFKPEGMTLAPFPVVRAHNALATTNIHRVDLARAPALDLKAKDLSTWLGAHVGSQLSARERSLRKKKQHENDPLMAIKDTLHTIFVRSTGIQGGAAQRVFALRDDVSNNCDTLFFVHDLKYDLPSHTVICEASVLPLYHELMDKIMKPFGRVVTRGVENVKVYKGEMSAWKQLLPALVERCRSSWTHGVNCEYKSTGNIPLTVDMEEDPLCSCGRGKDAEGMMKVDLWRPLAPHVTRLALSPLFAVSYLETVIRDTQARKCFVCRGKGKPKLMTCKVCKKVRYCSEACQKRDWKVHKKRCKA